MVFLDVFIRIHSYTFTGGENKLLIWNVGTGDALLEISGHPDMIWSVSFSYDGLFS